MFIRLLLSAVILLMTSICASSQIIHALVFCDTDDEKIGESTSIDHDRIITDLSNYADFIGYDILPYDYFGNNCSKETLLEILNEMEVEPNDIVVFFYSGHGARALNNDSDPLPQMCLGSTFDSEFVPLQYVLNRLSEKNPRLLLSFTNCCNKESDLVTIKPLLAQAQDPTSKSKIDTEAYKKLFTEPTGQAIITSSKAGEYSWCSSTVGGLFITDLLDVLYLVGEGKINPTWNDVFENAKIKTSARTITIRTPPYSTTQTPYYAIIPGSSKDKDGKTDNNNKRDDNTDRKDEIREADPLASALNDLVNKSYSVDARLGLIPIILSKYFAPEAKVRTLGRNGMTIDYEPAKNFLRRAALSNRIDKITIVRRDNGNKHQEISIHEIHE